MKCKGDPVFVFDEDWKGSLKSAWWWCPSRRHGGAIIVENGTVSRVHTPPLSCRAARRVTREAAQKRLEALLAFEAHEAEMEKLRRGAREFVGTIAALHLDQERLAALCREPWGQPQTAHVGKEVSMQQQSTTTHPTPQPNGQVPAAAPPTDSAVARVAATVWGTVTSGAFWAGVGTGAAAVLAALRLAAGADAADGA